MATGEQLAPAQPLWFMNNLAYVHIDGAASGGTFTLVELHGGRGDMAPLHVHHRDDETFYVIDGELSLFFGGKRVAVGPGQAELAPREVAHTYRVESEQARWLVVASPAGFDSFVRAVAEAAPTRELPPPGREHDRAVLAAKAAAVGIEILGPPGALPAP